MLILSFGVKASRLMGPICGEIIVFLACKAEEFYKVMDEFNTNFRTIWGSLLSFEMIRYIEPNK